jgi:hypothetical protein
MKQLVNYRERPDEPKLYMWNCDEDLRRARRVATELNLPWEEIEAWLHNHGGKCDCTVMFNAVNYWNMHRAGERCACGYVGWCAVWNDAQRWLQLIVAASFLAPFAGIGIGWLYQFVDRSDPVNLAGFVFFAFCWLCACARGWGWMVGIRIDKDDATG